MVTLRNRYEEDTSVTLADAVDGWRTEIRWIEPRPAISLHEDVEVPPGTYRLVADVEEHIPAPESPDPRGMSGFARGRLYVVETVDAFVAFPIDAEEVSIDTE
jgi:hypothetical protein